MYFCLRKQSIHVVIVIILSTISTVSLADTYYVVPTLSHPCPEGNVQCITLSQYADKLNTNKLSQNESLIMFPGNHMLNQELLVSNITQFELSSSSLSIHTQINCMKKGRFVFKYVTSVHACKRNHSGWMQKKQFDIS